MKKGTDEQPDEEIHRARSERELLFPWSWGVRHVTLYSNESKNQTE